MKLLKFFADWCGPCKALEKTLGNIEHENIDIELNEELTSKYGIRSIPTLVLVDDEGKEMRRLTGAVTLDEINKFLKCD